MSIKSSGKYQTLKFRPNLKNGLWFPKFKDWMDVLKLWLVLELSKNDLWPIHRPTLAPNAWFLKEISGYLRFNVKPRNQKSVFLRLALNVLNINILSQRKEFLKNILPSAHNRKNGTPLEKPLFPPFLWKLTNKLKKFIKAQISAFYHLKTYSKLVGITAIL